MPRPMPLLPPVTKATLPSTSFIGVGIVEGQLPAGASAALAGRPRISRAADVPAAASAVPPMN